MTIAIPLTYFENGWLVVHTGQHLGRGGSCVHLPYTSGTVWRHFRSFSTRVGSYADRTSTSFTPTPTPLTLPGRNSQREHQEMALTAGAAGSATPDEKLSSASSWHPSAFRFNSSRFKNLETIPSSGPPGTGKPESVLTGTHCNFFLPPLQEASPQ